MIYNEKEKINTRFRKLNGLLLLLLGILIGGVMMKFGATDLLNGYILPNDNSKENEIKYYKDKYSRFEQIDRILENGYYDYEKLDQRHMLQEALKSYIDGIDDPYTVYMDSNQNSGFINSLEGESEFEGIGAVVTKKDYYVLIEEVLKGSPAFKAGIKALDRVIKIDDQFVQDETLDSAVARMRGPAGTTVHVVVERDKKNNDESINTNKEILEFDIVRDKINLPSVTSEVFDLGDKKIAYVEIFLIGEETEKIFKKEIEKLKKEKVDGIILDLRGNGGGLMPIAVEILSHFIEPGKLVVSAKYKGYEDENYYSKGYGDFEGVKIVVLIDGMTASAGEIIAMALQEQAGAKLVGTTSFGKGTIQTLEEFNDGDSLKYTIGKRFPPNGINIDKIGVDPDITIEFDLTGYVNSGIDNQLQEAKSLFK